MLWFFLDVCLGFIHNDLHLDFNSKSITQMVPAVTLQTAAHILCVLCVVDCLTICHCEQKSAGVADLGDMTLS